MAWSFGDGFDLYTAVADATGYWDTVTSTGLSVIAGRFAGSQAVSNAGAAGSFAKSSATNDAVHHICIAFKQTAAISGTNKGISIELFDGAGAQCSVVFRSDGAILLTSGAAAGATLATYTSAVTGGVWNYFEFEIVINNTTGSFKARKDGSSTDSFSATGLNTRPGSANNYANYVKITGNVTVNAQQFDDFFWKSDASSVAWLGEIRCYTRMPASDQSVTLSKSPASVFTQNTSSTATTASYTAGVIRMMSVTATYTGSLVSLSCNFSSALTGHAKMAVYDNTGVGAGPGALVAQSAELTNPGTGVNVFTVAGGPSITKGAVYWLGIWNDAAFSAFGANSSAANHLTLAYTTSFPSTAVGFVAQGALSGVGSQGMNVVPTNAALVNEAQQDGTTTYVYSSTVNNADLYGIASIASTPATVIATTTRAYVSKSDAGARTAAVQLKSGATTVASPTVTLGSPGWQWAWRTDTTDPNTGTAWTAAAVNAAQIGPKVIA